MTKEWLNLQLFGEGGDGGAPAGEAPAETSGEDIPSSIPARARDRYKRAVKATTTEAPVSQAEPTPATEEPKKLSYEELIKSPEYKDDHQKYFERALSERLKNHKIDEEKLAKSNELLGYFAQMNGLDIDAEDFFDKAKEKIVNDESKIEQYAMDHDISTEEAKRVMELERRVAAEEMRSKRSELMRQEQEKMQLEEQQRAENQMRLDRLRANAEITKQKFPGFNLETELQDQRFVRLCIANNDDTTAAYMACHWNDVINNTAQYASQQAQIQTANSIASGKNRPQESGLSSGSTAVFEQNFRGMNKQQLAAYAAEQRRLMGK